MHTPGRRRPCSSVGKTTKLRVKRTDGEQTVRARCPVCSPEAVVKAGLSDLVKALLLFTGRQSASMLAMAHVETAPCPTCGRAVSLRLGACPYDGTPVDSATAIAVASTINPSLKGLEASSEVERRLKGEAFGKYVVEELIGRGGMGTVYRVTHADLGNSFALKLMDHRIVDSADAHTRFLREARAAARIDHPNVIRVLDYARHPTLGSYLVMDLLVGTSLDKLLAAEGPLSEGRTIALGMQVCDALAAAHDEGVVHRDLKPANIFLTRGRGDETVKVMDFGVAKVAADAATLLTRPGTVIGTPLYMSPEQWDNRDIGPRSDIYSFGVVLYEMLTGRVPIRGAGITEVAKNLATTKPLPPRAIRPEISPAMEAIVLRCLEKEANDRFATMRDVSEALAEALASPATTSKGAAKPSPRRRWLAVAAGGIGVMGIVYAFGFARVGDRQPAERRAVANPPPSAPLAAAAPIAHPLASSVTSASASVVSPAPPSPAALASSSATARPTPRAPANVPSRQAPRTPKPAATNDLLFGE